MHRDDGRHLALPVADCASNAESVLRRLALTSICALAAAIPTDYLVAFVLKTDHPLRAPSVYLSIGALILSLPSLPGARLGRRVAPIALVAGSMAAAALSLLVLRWTGFASGPLPRLDWPLRLAIMSVLFAFAAGQQAWRRRLLASYLLGWGTLVLYGLYLLSSGRAEIQQQYEVSRASLVGLDPNAQSVLIATGMVLLFDGFLTRASLATIPLYVGALLGGGVVFASGVSRSATLALACGLSVVLVGWLWSGRTRLDGRAVKVVLALALLAGGAAVVVQQSRVAGESVNGIAERLRSTVSDQDFGQRDELARRTWQIALANPWHGVGLGQVRTYVGEDPHNGYLRVFAEGGFFGALLLMAGLLIAASSLLRQVRTGRGAGPAGAFVVLLIWAAAGQAFVEVPFWFFLGVLVSTGEEHSA